MESITDAEWEREVTSWPVVSVSLTQLVASLVVEDEQPISDAEIREYQRICWVAVCGQ